MPILDLQKKMAETGRIRMGEKRVSQKSGKEYPAKLDTFRLTSKHRHVVDAAAEQYGGTVEAFNDGQWAVTTTAKSFEVVVPPGNMSFSQWNEMWGNGFCARRCDGQKELNSDGPCQCPADPAERAALAAKGKACKATTRLSVMLPELPGVGLWRLESHGYYAATELAGAIEIIQGLAPGTLVRARLSAEERSVVRFDRDGNPQTQVFIVPVLDLADVRLAELMAPSGDGVSVAIEPRASGLTAVPELGEGPRMSVADQLAAELPEPAKRSNAAAELPATGLKPKRAPAPAGDEPVDAEPVDAEPVDGEPVEVEVVDEPAPATNWTARNKKLQAEVHEIFAGESDRSIDDRRKHLVYLATDGRTRSSKEMGDEEWDLVFATTEQLSAGQLVMVRNGVADYTLRPPDGSDDVGQPDPASVSGLELPSSSDEWKALIARAGLKQADVIRQAQQLAGQGGPGSISALVGHDVAGDVLVWLQQQAAA